MSHTAAELHRRPESTKHIGFRQQELFCAHHWFWKPSPQEPMCMRDSNKVLNARKKPMYHWTAGYGHLWPMEQYTSQEEIMAVSHRSGLKSDATL